MIEGKQTKRPLYPHDVDRLPEAVEHEGLIMCVHPPLDITEDN